MTKDELKAQEAMDAFDREHGAGAKQTTDDELIGQSIEAVFVEVDGHIGVKVDLADNASSTFMILLSIVNAISQNTKMTTEQVLNDVYVMDEANKEAGGYIREVNKK